LLCQNVAHGGPHSTRRKVCNLERATRENVQRSLQERLPDREVRRPHFCAQAAQRRDVLPVLPGIRERQENNLMRAREVPYQIVHLELVSPVRGIRNQRCQYQYTHCAIGHSVNWLRVAGRIVLHGAKFVNSGDEFKSLSARRQHAAHAPPHPAEASGTLPRTSRQSYPTKNAVQRALALNGQGAPAAARPPAAAQYDQ
jgi:hypothetical protein